MKISVIIPTYNREKFIEKSIRSVLNQTYPVDEVIVVDDHSTDNTKSVVEGIQDDRIRYIYLEENGGPAKARNYGVSIASNDWIAFHDSDDEWRDYKIEKQVQYLNEHQGIDFVYSAYQIDVYTVPQYAQVERYEGDMLPILLDVNTVGAPTILMKKQLFIDNGGFDEGMRALEDWELAIKLSVNHKFGFVEEPLLDVYRVDESISENMGNHISMLSYILGKYKKYYLEYNKFNERVLEIMDMAKKMGVEKQTEDLLAYYLTMF